jgi:hypothetical protein
LFLEQLRRQVPARGDWAISVELDHGNHRSLQAQLFEPLHNLPLHIM